VINRIYQVVNFYRYISYRPSSQNAADLKTAMFSLLKMEIRRNSEKVVRPMGFW